MTLPGIVYGFLIASAAGAAFHLVRGGRLARLGLYLVSAWASFAIGHIAGEILGIHLWRLGPLNLFTALIGTVTGLFTAAFLAGPELPSTPGRGRRSPPFGDES